MEKPYICPKEIRYYSNRYKKRATVPEGYESDGATGAIDIWSDSWWVHDWLTDKGKWDDGTPVTVLQESMVIHDILDSEGRIYRAKYWFVSTFVFRRIKKRFSGWLKK